MKVIYSLLATQTLIILTCIQIAPNFVSVLGFDVITLAYYVFVCEVANTVTHGSCAPSTVQDIAHLILVLAIMILCVRCETASVV
jgi:hypothetical protein